MIEPASDLLALNPSRPAGVAAGKQGFKILTMTFNRYQFKLRTSSLESSLPSSVNESDNPIRDRQSTIELQEMTCDIIILHIDPVISSDVRV